MCQPALGATPALVGHIAEVRMCSTGRCLWGPMDLLLTLLSWKRHKYKASSMRGLKARTNKLRQNANQSLGVNGSIRNEQLGARLGVEEMDLGGSRNSRAALLPTHRCKCYSPAFPPALFSAGLYRVCFALWFYFSQASCGGIHPWGVRTHRHSLSVFCSDAARCPSQGVRIPLGTGVPFGARVPFSVAALLLL